MIFQFLGNGIINGSLIALTALGFALIYNTMRVFHIAYAGIYLWAGYVLYFFMEQMQWPLFLSLGLAFLASALLSVACEVLVYKPLIRKGRSESALMISSVGVLILMVSLVELLFGNSPLYFDFTLNGFGLSSEFFISGTKLFGLLASAFTILFFFVYIKYSPTGIRIRALRDSESLSRLFGVRTTRLKLLLYTLSGVFVALAACLNALDVGINPQLGIPVFINAFVALVIGGVGRFDGPVIGGILLGVMQALTEYFFDSRWVMMVTFILLIIFLVFRPQGLIPQKSRAF
jgi:branched-chain amino acid transport system permease protein